MNVFMCGYNGFSQLDWNCKSLRVNVIPKQPGDYDNCHRKLSVVEPSCRLSLPDGTRPDDINIHFTWSRCVVTLRKDKDNATTYVLGYNANRSTSSTPSEIVLENSICASVVDGSGTVVIREGNGLSSSPTTCLSILPNGAAHSYPISVRSESKEESSCLNLHHVGGGHKDVYAVYDGVSFGKLQLPDDIQRTSDVDTKQSDTVTLHMDHLGCVPSIREMSCGKEHVLLLSNTGSVYSCGLSSRGQLGHGDIEKELSPRLVEALDGLVMKSVVAGGWHSMAVSDIGDVYVWGWNESGQLGLLGSSKQGHKGGHPTLDDGGDDDDGSCLGIVATPVCLDMPGGANVRQVACGARHSIVLTENGVVYSCGWNGYGQLAVGDTDNRRGLRRVHLPLGVEACRVFGGQWNTAIVGCREQTVDNG